MIEGTGGMVGGYRWYGRGYRWVQVGTGGMIEGTGGMVGGTGGTGGMVGSTRKVICFKKIIKLTPIVFCFFFLG